MRVRSEMQIAQIPRIKILQIPVDVVCETEAIYFADQLVVLGQKGTIFAVNPEKIMRARENEELKCALDNSSLLIPDGVGVTWAARALALTDSMDRVAGADLMPKLCELAERKLYRVFLFGGKEEVNRRAVEELQLRFPALQISGRHHGYVNDLDGPALIREINASKTQILFVALGSPRQELWISRYQSELDVSVCQGIGGTLDILAGSVKRAPEVWRRNKLEWLYRLLNQPSRILRQATCIKFVTLVMLEVIVLRWFGKPNLR